MTYSHQIPSQFTIQDPPGVARLIATNPNISQGTECLHMKKKQIHPRRLTAGTWEYGPPGNLENHLPHHHDFRFDSLIFGGVCGVSQHYGPSYFLKHSHVELGAKQTTVQSMLNTTNYLEAEQPQLGDLPTIVANYSLTAIILQVVSHKSIRYFLQLKKYEGNWATIPPFHLGKGSHATVDGSEIRRSPVYSK